MNSKKFMIVPLACCLLLASCFGFSADITLNANGTGIIVLEYRISQALDALGRLDGNARWNTIPVGRADFERTLDRLPDMRLLSFSSRQDERDIIVSARMEFSSIQGLLAFLDASDQRAVFTGTPASGSLVFTLSEGTPDEPTDDTLAALIALISEGYAVALSMTFPGQGSLTLRDGQNLPLAEIPGSEINASGRRVSASFPLYEVLAAAGGINLEFRW